MNKEESLSFLQSCIEKVNLATEQDVKFFQKVYEKDCVTPVVSPGFEFVFPTSDFECQYEIKDIYNLITSSEDYRSSTKKEISYNFLGVELINQQNSDNLPYAS